MTLQGLNAKSICMWLAALVILGVFFWQGLTSHGSPNPSTAHLSPTAAVVDTGILVFREGLESILVLSAITASLSRTDRRWGKPVAAGAGVALLTTLATWFVVVAILSDVNAPELDLQAATGLLAVVVLLLVMNWFFHKVYWTGWITQHTRTERALLDNPAAPGGVIFRGLLLLGFASVYREGFEVVLFLQSLRLQVGTHIVLVGTLIGMALTATVAALNFVYHHRLPYRKMLVLTGVLLGGVLLVMVGETVQEMQQAGWIATTKLLHFELPNWMNVWFSLYNSRESIAAQVAAFLVVVGSYLVATRARGIRAPRPAIARPG